MRLFRRVLALPLRLIGYATLVLWLAAAVHDGWRAVASGRLALTPLGELWFAVSPETLGLAQPAVQRYVSPFLWDPVIQTLLVWPAVLSLGLVAALFLVVARAIHRTR